MEVNVKLYSELKRFAPGGSNIFTLALPPGAAVRDLLKILQIPGEVPRFIVVNGRRCDDNVPLSAGDTIVLFTPVDGG